MFLDWQNASSALIVSLVERLEDDQIQHFTHDQNVLQRVLAIVASVVSIVFCLAAIYCFLAIDPKRLVFRHQLIAFLILFDLLKAVVLLIFPSRVLTHPDLYFNDVFCQVIGFFTATCIEGADLAILSFAVHTFLLIFKPSLTMKLPDSDRVEGGLYRYRYYVYGLSFIIPLALASFPYIGVGYESFVCWCYLPQRPVWYRLVLSWVPRYLIVVIILSVYGSIYYHVLKEFRTLGGVFSTMHRLKHRTTLHPTSLMAKPSFFSAIRYFFETLRDHLFPKLMLPGESSDISSHDSSTDSNIDPIALENYETRVPPNRNNANNSSDVGPTDPENAAGQDAIQAANLEHFRHRQKVIEKQMKSIFVYPFAYILMWLFPFILQCTQINYEFHHGPLVWLNCVGAFMQPFYGFVDSMVFFYREQPWKHTIMENFSKLYSTQLESFCMRHSSCGDTDSTLTTTNLAKSAQVDISQYSRWRQILCKLRFPLMQLPTERNVAKLQTAYMAKRKQHMADHAANMPFHGGLHIEPTTDFNDLLGKHDFSNLLSDSMSDADFRLSFNRYTMNFQPDSARPSIGADSSIGTAAHSGGAAAAAAGRRTSVVSTSNRSNKSRRYSVINDSDPIPEGAAYTPGVGKARAGTIVSGRKSLQRASTSNDSTNKSMDSETNDVELDLFEFLQKGPQ